MLNKLLRLKWIIRMKTQVPLFLPVRLTVTQIQTHKHLWNPPGLFHLQWAGLCLHEVDKLCQFFSMIVLTNSQFCARRTFVCLFWWWTKSRQMSSDLFPFVYLSLRVQCRVSITSTECLKSCETWAVCDYGTCVCVCEWVGCFSLWFRLDEMEPIRSLYTKGVCFRMSFLIGC